MSQNSDNRLPNSSFLGQPYNVNTSHPLITNAQDYMYYKKFVSIHSEDRDIIKYPNSAEFEIELPEDYLNVSSLQLVQWTFPANYNTFSVYNSNVLFTFKINNPYNPSVPGDYYYRIYEALFINQQNLYTFTIEEGFYNPTQMCVELTNKFNNAVSEYIRTYFTDKGWTDTLNEFNLNGGYNRFVIVYNSVSLKIWFGNNSDGFILTNTNSVMLNNIDSNECDQSKRMLPNSTNWGLPGYIGLPRYDSPSISSSEASILTPSNPSTCSYNNITVPRFYYGDVFPGDDGFWLIPNTDLSVSNVYWVESYYKINLMGDAFLYMELFGQNCIDETQPFNISTFTATTNQTNGVVNSAFAKLPIPSTPISQWFDRESRPYKYYYPPAERIRKFKIKIRYHNGQLATFGNFNFSFMIELTLLVPQINRNVQKIYFNGK